MILTRELKKSFGQSQVLQGLDLVAEPGAVTLLVGANGAGKTTALRLLAGLSEPDSGELSIAGFDLRRDRGQALASLSFLPQSPRFHPRLTARQVADFYARLRGRDRRAVTVELDAWGLTDSADKPTGKLSGGLRQRLALAIFALANAPVLLLDEPGLSLDPVWRVRLQEFLMNEARRGRTVLVASHLLGEWEGNADRCLLIENGRCSREILPADLRQAFFNPDGASSVVPPLAVCA